MASSIESLRQGRHIDADLFSVGFRVPALAREAPRQAQRFSPRTSKSTWSNINIKRAGELRRLGLMQPPGVKVFATRDPARSGLYSCENRPRTLSPALERRFKANKKAWLFFQAQPPGYRRVITFMVMSAKQDETRERRVERVMKASGKGLRLI